MDSASSARPAAVAAKGRLRDAMTPDVSRAIRIARVMCITMMMTVHVWPGAKAITSAEVPLALHWFYVLVIRQFGEASVPLLSVVSGLLFYRSARSGKSVDLVASKIRTLMVPMVIWSAILLVMFVVFSAATGDRAFFDVRPMDWINRVFAITAPPINDPLAFLRDIFMCCLIALAAVRLEQVLPWSGRVALVAITAAEVYTDGMLMLRPQVLLCFAVGIFMAMTPPRSFVLPWSLVWAVVVFDLVVQYGPLDLTTTFRDLTDLLHRFAVAMLMWRTSVAIARRDGWLRRLMERVEPMIFLVFCSHMLTIRVMAVLFNGLNLWVDSTVYPLIFVIQIPVVYMVALLLNALGEAHAPRLLAVMSARKHVPKGHPASGTLGDTKGHGA